MPAYNAAPNVPAIWAGDPPAVVVNAEKPVAGTKHQQVALGSVSGDGGQHQCYLATDFAAAPSAVGVKAQHAAVDKDAAYSDVAGASSASTSDDNVMFTTNLPFVRLVTTTAPDQNMTARIGKRS
jgi:hypothetical protein